MDRTCILQLRISLSEGAIIGAINGYGKPIIMKIPAGVKKRTDL
jgi:predicted ATP-binding protein involved in virulence